MLCDFTEIENKARQTIKTNLKESTPHRVSLSKSKCHHFPSLFLLDREAVNAKAAPLPCCALRLAADQADDTERDGDGSQRDGDRDGIGKHAGDDGGEFRHEKISYKSLNLNAIKN